MVLRFNKLKGERQIDSYNYSPEVMIPYRILLSEEVVVVSMELSDMVSKVLHRNRFMSAGCR